MIRPSLEISHACKGFSKWSSERKLSCSTEKGGLNAIFRREKSLHFPMGERGKSQMGEAKDTVGLQFDDVSDHVSFQRLLFRKQALLGQSAAHRQNTNNQDHAADEIARASISSINTMAFALDHKRARNLRRVEDALERWKRGVYGHCTTCDEPIEEGRLEAVPETELCLSCKEIEEKTLRAGVHCGSLAFNN